MQLTENDATKDLPANLADSFSPPADIEPPKARAPQEPARAADPARAIIEGPMFDQIDDILAKTDLPARTVLNIRKVVQTELDTMSAEVASRIRAG